MKNTQANKERFFALYWGQRYAFRQSSFIGRLVRAIVNNRTFPSIDYLELTPLSLITDEHLKQIGFEFPTGTEGVEIDFTPLSIEQHWIGKRHGIIQNVGYFHLGQFEFLRANGYVMPWTTPQGETITVEEQIEFGWVKLKNK